MAEPIQKQTNAPKQSADGTLNNPARERKAAEELDRAFDVIASGLYSLASMLVGEGEDSIVLVESTIANAEVSACCDSETAHSSGRWVLARNAIDLLGRRDPGSLAAPEDFEPAQTCIEDDDLAATGVSHEELERMMAGSDRDRLRAWLESLPTAMRAVFVLRAVARFTSPETAGLLAESGGPLAANWTPDAVREYFRQGLCSLASQLIHAGTRA